MELRSFRVRNMPAITGGLSRCSPPPRTRSTRLCAPIESCLDTINEKIAYLMIGTHGRGIEERLFETLTQAGWSLEVERPSFFGIRDAKPVLEVDGVQGWRNPALTIG